MYVQYGCGADAPASWVNFDASLRLIAERIPLLSRAIGHHFQPHVRYGNIVRGLPIPAASCDGLYCSHILEHLTRADCLAALKNSRSYLKPDGTFRLVVPDLDYLAREYLRTGDSFQLLGECGPGLVSAPSWRSRLAHHLHLWIWDERSMAAQDARFNEVEMPARFVNCLAMECRP